MLISLGDFSGEVAKGVDVSTSKVKQHGVQIIEPKPCESNPCSIRLRLAKHSNAGPERKYQLLCVQGDSVLLTGISQQPAAPPEMLNTNPLS